MLDARDADGSSPLHKHGPQKGAVHARFLENYIIGEELDDHL